uniref:Transmembrane protein n=1 Tax=Ananas comosus var. bracteatus TaxID=296719 RepID=A0A6V7P039_ANACO|nr:unnamed protein product [Ananas comosus var. bracteatus]
MSSLKQPMVVYPQNTVAQHPSNPRSSFTPVFVVLGVIAVISVISCFFGQICARRYLRPRHRRDHFHSSKVDMEHGLEPGVPTAEPVRSGRAAEHHMKATVAPSSSGVAAAPAPGV